jgi:hypothetical protein
LLAHIRSPRDVRDLTAEELPQLAAEIRDTLIKIVSKNGGHLGPNLGVVELTIALHRVFERRSTGSSSTPPTVLRRKPLLYPPSARWGSGAASPAT